MIGTTIGGRYYITSLLGIGGFGTTYLARDTQLPGNPVLVVKHFTPATTDPKAEELFVREAQTLKNLKHPQIPNILAYITENQQLYIVQEFIDGHDLKEDLRPGIPLHEDFVIKLLQEILEVLVYIHDQEVIHRDLKPSNIRRRETDNKIVIIDFGAVKKIITQQLGNQQNNITYIGSPGYAPKEQTQGKPEFSSDIYAVGMIGIQALTGKDPGKLELDSQTEKVIWRNQIKVSDEFAAILNKMVEPNLKDRYRTATEALEALAQISSTPTPPTPLPTPLQPATPLQPPTPSKNKYLLLKIAPVGLMIIIGVIVFLKRPIPECDGKLTTYQNSEHNLNIDYPQCWEKNTTPNLTNGKVVTFRKPQKNVSLIIMIPEYSGTLKQYQESREKAIKRDLESSQVIDRNEPTIAGGDGREIIVTSEDNGEKIKNMYVMTLRGNKAYLINYTATMDDYDRFLPTVEKMIESLKIN
ncbi:protein kinase [Dolichospermum sp. UHCC 0684]|jgi:eukaryotic-like serine/threonine-protein kinase|uniref:serine/threonine-protein kinase n=1 Tax=unclassified Dolichospermum TaxID=2622029 RepID=UPI001445E4FF|nr:MULTISPECIES: serine/threonine-protein kinase [unclassified Dolichospermum]MEA5530213.1 protein kinase [Dolichospermum sp. UHCC 0684]